MALKRSKFSFDSKFQEKASEIRDVLTSELDTINRANPHQNDRVTTLYQFQIEAALRTHEYLTANEGSSGKQPILIVAPTGCGKSGISVLLPYVLGSSKVLILSPFPYISSKLAQCFGCEQYEESFFHKVNLTSTEADYLDFMEMSCVADSCNDISKWHKYRLVIANAQTIGASSGTRLFEGRNGEVVENVKSSLARFTTIIVNEAHHYTAQVWKNIVRTFIGKQLIFLTATPYYKKGKILGPDQRITYEVTKQMVQGVTMRRMRFEELDLPIATGKLDQDTLTNIGDRINKLLDGHDLDEPSVKHKALILVSQQGEAESASHHMKRTAHCKTNRSAKNNIIGFEGNKYRIMTISGNLQGGYENNDISACVILRKVQSRNLFTQFVGRCRRTSFPNDSVTAVILSHPIYGQKCMWEQHEELPEEDP